MAEGFLGRWRAGRTAEPHERGPGWGWDASSDLPHGTTVTDWQLAALDEALRAFGRQLDAAADSPAGPSAGSPVDAHPPTEAERVVLGHLAAAQDAYQDALHRAATTRLDRPAEREAVFADLKRGSEALGLHELARADADRLAGRVRSLRDLLDVSPTMVDDPSAEAELARAVQALAQARAAADGVAPNRDRVVDQAVAKGRASLARVETRRREGADCATLIGSLRERIDLARTELTEVYPDGDTPPDLLDGLRAAERQLRRAAQASSPTVPGRRLPAVRDAVNAADAALKTLEARQKATVRERTKQARAAGKAAAERAAAEHTQHERALREAESERLSAQLHADIAAYEAELTAVRPTRPEQRADPVIAAQVRRAEGALRTATAIARGGGDSRRDRAVEVLRLGRAALDGLSGIGEETAELAAAVKGLRERIATAKPDPTRPEDDAVLAEFRDARRALDEAAMALRTPGAHRTARVFAAIGAGRAALLRLAARRAGDPVPLTLARPEELVRPDWERHVGTTADPFLFRGTGPVELLVTDRPVRDRPALVEIALDAPVDGPADADAELVFLCRDEAETRESRGDRFTGAARGVYLLPTRITHLKIDCEPTAAWTVRIAPVSDAPVLRDALQGDGSAVLWLSRAAAHRLRVEALAPSDESEVVEFVDPLMIRRGAPFDYFGLQAHQVAHGRGEARGELWVEGPGFVVIKGPGRWSVRARPEGQIPHPERRATPNAELHRELRAIVAAGKLGWPIKAVRLYYERTGGGRHLAGAYLRAILNELYLAGLAGPDEPAEPEPAQAERPAQRPQHPQHPQQADAAGAPESADLGPTDVSPAGRHSRRRSQG